MFGINPGLDAFWAGAIFGLLLAVYFFVTHIEVDHGPERWQRWRATWIMSRDRRREMRANQHVPPVVAISTATEQPIVPPNNEYNGNLSDNARVVFETTAKNIATMYEKGIVTNLSKAICAAYGCTVQSAAKSDSTYQLALKAVNRHLTKKGPQFRPMTPEQEATREALGLDRN